MPVLQSTRKADNYLLKHKRSWPEARLHGPWSSGLVNQLAGVGLGFCLLAGAANLNAQITSGGPHFQFTAKPLFPVVLAQPFPHASAAFDQTRTLILQNYYSTTVTEEALYHAAIRGMLRHISPPEDPERAMLWSPESFHTVSNKLYSLRVSLGIRSTYNQHDGALTVTSVATGSPAEGRLQRHDRIMRVDGTALKGQTLAAIRDSLSGVAGKTVRLTIVRDIMIREIELTLAPFEVIEHAVRLLPDGVGYVRIKRMTKGISVKVKAAIEVLRSRGARALVIDLRENSGGVFAEGLRVAELFVRKGVPLLHSLGKGSKVHSYRAGNEAPFTGPLALLVDSSTASAAEMVAAALARRQGTLLVGDTTFGKGVLEQTFTLDNDYRVKFIVGALYGPTGRSWQSRGISPSVLTKDTSSPDNYLQLAPSEWLNKDTALRAAWQFLIDGKWSRHGETSEEDGRSTQGS